MWCLKKISLIFLVILLSAVSAANAQCPHELGPIQLHLLQTTGTYTENNYTFKEVKEGWHTGFDHRKLWNLVKIDANYLVILDKEGEVASHPNETNCIYKVSLNRHHVTKFVIHGKRNKT
jgi:hypothetical protein